jgi:hypothetical protein
MRRKQRAMISVRSGASLQPAGDGHSFRLEIGLETSRGQRSSSPFPCSLPTPPRIPSLTPCPGEFPKVTATYDVAGAEARRGLSDPYRRALSRNKRIPAAPPFRKYAISRGFRSRRVRLIGIELETR